MNKKHNEKIKKLKGYLDSVLDKRLYKQEEKANVSLKITNVIQEFELLSVVELNRLLKAYGLKYYILESVDNDKLIQVRNERISNPFYLSKFWVVSKYLSL